MILILINEQVLVRVKATALNIEDITVGAGEWPGLTLKPTKVDGDDDCDDNHHDDERHIHHDDYDAQASQVYLSRRRRWCLVRSLLGSSRRWAPR